MGRLAADDTGDFLAAAGADLNPLTQHYLRPPTAYRHELDESVEGDVLHHEPDLVHVACDHYPRPFVMVGADHRAVLIRGQGPDIGEFVDEDRPYLVFVTGNGMGFGEFLEKGECFGSHVFEA